MFAPVRTVAPAETPVSLAEAKAACRVDHSDEDAYITGLIEAATAHLDGWSGILGRALVSQTWSQTFGRFADRFDLPLAPVLSVTTVTYFDADNALQTWDAANYALLSDALGPYVARLPSVSFPSVYDREDPVTVTFVAGYGAASAVPAALRHAILLLVARWFENREGLADARDEIPAGARALIAPYRRISL